MPSKPPSLTTVPGICRACQLPYQKSSNCQIVCLPCKPDWYKRHNRRYWEKHRRENRIERAACRTAT